MNAQQLLEILDMYTDDSQVRLDANAICDQVVVVEKAGWLGRKTSTVHLIVGTDTPLEARQNVGDIIAVLEEEDDDTDVYISEDEECQDSYLVESVMDDEYVYICSTDVEADEDEDEYEYEDAV